jgi:predicted transcriptional regulator
MIRRSKLEVFMDIMKVVAEEREMRRTRIMYKANLAWKVLKDALDTLEKKGILSSSEKNSGVYVSLTPNGLSILNRFCEVESIFYTPVPSAEISMYPTRKMTISA